MLSHESLCQQLATELSKRDAFQREAEDQLLARNARIALLEELIGQAATPAEPAPAAPAPAASE